VEARGGTALLGAALLALALSRAGTATAADEPLDTRLEDPLGQDPTRPRPETILRYEFQNAPGRSPDSVNALLVEGITRVPVNEHWAGRLRLEMPLVLTNLPSDDHPDGTWHAGAGNLLTEAAGIFYPDDRWAVAAGGQVIYPTVSRDVTGDDAWVLGVGGVVRSKLRRPPSGTSSIERPDGGRAPRGARRPRGAEPRRRGRPAIRRGRGLYMDWRTGY